ncbi:ABC transporter substrate-binding protein [Limobrevibacterium gyesilva]|uniref:ABC transporter substrate-binding protein n=1 Tax=Limobrevibacterium gyesilva TaxID=2991712 RepID=A0AA41YYA5_9PROT|nr:ABC transporter substrate-binding protein [Limobrevibacterium gyesilva]MCW3477477.1 ABC transporter substrate-binding protein [Limobrevibacterium gyesilva]
MDRQVNRRSFINTLGVTVGAAAGLGAGLGASGIVPYSVARAGITPKGKIPDTPFKTGHMTFLTGPAAVLGEPSLKGHTLAAEEINAQGGLLGSRKIVTLTTDEAAGTDAAVKELRRLKLSENIDMFTGVISSGTSPALGPVAEELKVLTILTDGCTDFLFDKAVPNPKYVFRVTNIQSADGITAAIGVAQTWPQVRKIAHLHPDYSYGRNAAEHFSLAIERLLPGTASVAESWPKLGTTDFTPHITKTLSANPDLLICSVWGGDYVAFYKQALRYGLFDKMKVASTIAFGVAPHAIGKDHPEGVLAGVHANYHFTYPGGNRWPENAGFVQRYFKRWNEYPNFEAEGAYTSLYVLKTAIERANKLEGGWPGDEAIIGQIEGLGMDTPAGYLYIRPDNHQGYKDTVTGFSKNTADYPFPVLDPERIITIPIRNISAPAGWPKPGTSHNESTAAANWIKTTWPKAAG